MRITFNVQLVATATHVSVLPLSIISRQFLLMPSLPPHFSQGTPSALVNQLDTAGQGTPNALSN